MVSRGCYVLLFFLNMAIFACQLGGKPGLQGNAQVTAAPLATAQTSPSSPAAPGQVPDLAELALSAKDLPSGYERTPDSWLVLQPGDHLNMNMMVRSSFGYFNSATNEGVTGITILLPTQFTQDDFDLALHTQIFQRRLFGPDAESTVIPDSEQVGDSSVLYSADLAIQDIHNQLDCVAFRRQIVGAVVCYIYLYQSEPQLSAILLAQQFDQDIVLYLEHN